jgi:hypothetical protein
MHSRPRNQSIVYAGFTPVLLASIFWALTLAACPELHEWVHPDADHEDHDCAVTLFANGGTHFLSVDVPYVEKPADGLLLAVSHLCSQVVVSAQTERLIPGRGPPRIE